MASDRRKVLVLGACTLDLVAQVDHFPKPDAKVRTTAFTTSGGGNAGNTATALRRLGVETCVMTKIGTDPNGVMIREGLEAEGIDLSHLVVSPSMRTSHTYVIVDTEHNTRTCIHTPSSEDLLPEEVEHLDARSFSHLHFDSRHTELAVKLARAAAEAGVPTSIDAEKDRPHLGELLANIDYIFTNKHFAKAYTKCDDQVKAMVQLLILGRAKTVISTLGSRGCIAVYRLGSSSSQWEARPRRGEDNGEEDDDNVVRLPLHVAGVRCETQEVMIDGDTYEYVTLPAAEIGPEEVVDTTGAGDAFIGGAIFGGLQGYNLVESLTIGSLVAREKLKQPGARTGLPSIQTLLAVLRS